MKQLFAILFIVVLAGCNTDYAPPPESDSQQRYRSGSEVPVDDNIYTITGKVVADIDSLTRQTAPAQGAYSAGPSYGTGSYFGPQLGGKGFVRLFVHVAEPATVLAPSESITIIKTSDTKASALVPGDVITFKCRAQYEAIAAIRENETFNANRMETWELDYCRLVSPVITVKDEWFAGGE
jgi:hypothetical protein